MLCDRLSTVDLKAFDQGRRYNDDIHLTTSIHEDQRSLFHMYVCM